MASKYLYHVIPNTLTFNCIVSASDITIITLVNLTLLRHNSHKRRPDLPNYHLNLGNVAIKCTDFTQLGN